MITYVSEQTYVFLVTLYGGLIIGFMYDMYRIFRLIFSPKKIATMIEDFMFWTIMSIVATIVLVFGNEGEIRLYTMLGFFLGALSYKLLLSKMIVTFVIKIANMIKKIIIKLILRPIKRSIYLIKIPIIKLNNKIKPFKSKVNRLKKLNKRVAKDMKKYLKLIKEKK